MEEKTTPVSEAQAEETVRINPSAPQSPYTGFAAKMDKFWNITASGSNFKKEIVAGLTTFMTMCYILMVNAGMFTNVGVSYGAMYITTALAAIVGTLMMAFWAKMPFAQAPGMGLNAFFVFTVCAPWVYGYSYANGLVIILASGILFTCLTFGGIRQKIVRAVPMCVRIAIPAGIGLFIAFVGMQGIHLIQSDAILVDGAVSSSTIVKLIPMLVVGKSAVSFTALWPVAVCLLTLFGIAALSKKNVKGSILWGMLGGTVLYYAVGACVPSMREVIKATVTWQSPFKAFEDFGTQTVGKVFTEGFKGLFSDASSVLNFIAVFISFALVDMFDTIGTLLGTCQRADMLDENGEVPNINKALLCDSVATMAGAVLGTSTVTTFVESSAGVAVGGRTGFTAFVVAVLFFIAMFLSPLAALIPTAATSAALIYVGVLMMGGVTEIEWRDPSQAVPAFLTIAMMPLTYSISYGIAFGFISFVVIKLFTGKVKEIHPIAAGLAVLFLLNFLFVNHG